MEALLNPLTTEHHKSQISQSRINRFVNKSRAIYLFFWALHNETRISIVKQLAVRPKSVKELSKDIDELHSVTSFHLKHLRMNKIVTFDTVGKERIYRLTNILNALFETITEIDQCLNVKTF